MTSILTITAETDNKTVNIHADLSVRNMDESVAIAVEAQKIVWVIINNLPAKVADTLVKEIVERAKHAI